jgi:hypothetical protein
MGTSTANSGTGGSGTPLIPSWLEDIESSTDQSPKDTTAPAPRPPIPEPSDADRYRAPRTAFSRFARSGGSDRASLGRAVSGYVSRSSGGAGGAARRMGSSRRTGARLLGFLNDAVGRGVNEALRSLNLDGLAGRPVEEIFRGLADYFCPEGGNLDVAIARDAFFRTVADIVEGGVTDLDNLSTDQVQGIFEMFATHAIELRLYNEIGTRAITLPSDTAAIDNVQAQLHDFIANGVSDALSQMGDRLPNLSEGQLPEFVDGVLEKAFIVLAAMGDDEANR